ncbi:hypothetical protein GPN2_12409 [Streptomyces murinus]
MRASGHWPKRPAARMASYTGCSASRASRCEGVAERPGARRPHRPDSGRPIGFDGGHPVGDPTGRVVTVQSLSSASLTAPIGGAPWPRLTRTSLLYSTRTAYGSPSTTRSPR